MSHTLPLPTVSARRLRRHARLALLAAIAGVVVGVASWTFLEGLDWATRTRLAHPVLIWFLPIAGLVTGVAYHRFGGRAGEGNNLLLGEIHEPSTWVPRRMAPMVAIATVVSHLFGASVGREGTALQMSGSLTDLLNRTARVDKEDRRVLLIAALGGGFGAVFGVPWAGLVFGLEVQSIGRWRSRLALGRHPGRAAASPSRADHSADDPGDDDLAESPSRAATRTPARLRAAVVPTAIASFVGAAVVEGLGHHEAARRQFAGTIDVRLLLTALAIGAAAGLTAIVFVGLTDAIRDRLTRLVTWPPLRPLLGGIAVVALASIVGRQYLGLSLHLGDAALDGATTSFADPGWKLLLTALCIGTGFIGGEVTPMFVMGATLGGAVAHVCGVDPAVGASIGFASVFCGAANAPIACTVLAIEVFGARMGVPAGVACAAAFVASGRYGVYHHRPHPEEADPATATAQGTG
jgi:H+/Cl- antiporter ClcA